MKKYLFIIVSALLALVACTKFEDESSLAVVEVGAPTITINSVGDTDFKATIAPQTGTGFYSYAVLKGEPGTVNATNLLKVKLSGTLAAGTVDYAKTPSKVIELSDLARNTAYTVYAIAASEQGTVGEVVSQKLITSDAQIPSPAKFSLKDDVLTLTFSEEVTYKGKRATLNYYAINTPSGAEYNIYEDKPVGSIPVTVKAEGANATFTFSEPLPNGAYYTISYPAGTFVDVVGNPVNALESYFYGETDDSGKTTLKAKGVAGRIATKNFDLALYSADEEEAVIESVSNLMAPIWIDVPEDYVHFKAVVPATTKDIEGYSIVYEGDGETHTYTTPGPYDYGWNGTYNCALAYPNASSGRPDPEPGNYITITIPEGFLTDIYDNTNNAFVIGPFIYSYGYTLEDIIGSYTAEVVSYFDGEMTDSFVIAESDDPEKGNVMFTTIFGDPVDEGLNVYADFDMVGGTLTIPDWQKIWWNERADGYWYFAVNGADEVVLSVPAPGTIQDTGTWFGYYVSGNNGKGWGDVYKSFSATRIDEAAETSITPSSVIFKDRVIKKSERVIR